MSGDRVRRGAQVVRPSVQEAVAKQSERNGSSPLSMLRSSGHVTLVMVYKKQLIRNIVCFT